MDSGVGIVFGGEVARGTKGEGKVSCTTRWCLRKGTRRVGQSTREGLQPMQVRHRRILEAGVF